MADGRWVMTEFELNSVACNFEHRDLSKLPHYKERKAVDDRARDAKKVCAFCGNEKLEAGFGGYGEGFGYHSFLCPECGGNTDFVYKDEVGKYFE